MQYLIKARLFWFILLLIPVSSFSQITLEQVLAEARRAAPIYSLFAVTEQELELQKSNIGKQNLPQISLLGKASYQSDVTSIDFEFPGANFVPLSKDQYKISADLSQNLYNGGRTKHQSGVAEATSAINRNDIELDLEKIRLQIINLYFGVLEIQSQVKVLDASKHTLSSNLKTLEIRVREGVALRADLNSLKAALVQLNMQIVELEALKANLIQSLGLYTKADIEESEIFDVPAAIEAKNILNPNQLSLRQFGYQKDMISLKYKLKHVATKPNLGLFLQTGYGKPGLNFLKDEFEAYYLGGLQLRWNFGSFYTDSNDKKISFLHQEKLIAKRTTYLLHNEIERNKEVIKIKKLSALIEQEQELINLRTEITLTAKDQMDNGALNTADYITRFNEEKIAKQRLFLREIQLMKSQYLLQHITGNYSKPL